MLKLISIQQLRVGMYIHQFCGAWQDHTFWKAGFLLRSQEDFQRLRQSNLAFLWIDSDQGCDVAAHQSEPCPPVTAPSRHTERREEMRRALKLCAHSKDAVMAMFNEVRLGKVLELEQADELVQHIAGSLVRHPDTLISLARLKTADNYTYMHSVAVCALMIAVARQMNLPSPLVHQAGIAGLLHDVGKLVIPESILNKPQKLSESEFEQIKHHPQAGASILRQSHKVDALVLDVCLHHHEKVDGSGYPHRLAGEQISLFAQMGAVCDVYDAVTSNRPYNRGWDPAEAIHKMSGWNGHFNQRVFQALVKSVGIYPVGSLVRLESGRLGVVLEQHADSLLTPRVKVFFSTRTKRSIPQTVLDLARLEGEERIVGRESPERWNFDNLEQLWTATGR